MMKEQDIRSRAVHNRYLELVKNDSEEIFKDRSTFVAIHCPACDSVQYSFQFEKLGFSCVLCQDCDTLFVNPRPSYEQLKQIYADSRSTRFWIQEFFLPVFENRRRMIFVPRAEFITTYFPQLKSKRIGDVGAGFGIFLEEVRRIWPDGDFTAIEPSIEMSKICRQNGLRVIDSMIEDLDPARYQFDLLTAFELFEHLCEPFAFMKKIYQLLSPGGYFFFTTLNGLGFDIQLLWNNSKAISPPHHLNFVNPHSIKTMLQRSGFDVIHVSTPGELDWDIIENAYVHENTDPGRFYRMVSRYGTDQSKGALQSWIKEYNFSSHMRVVAQKPEP